MNGKHYKDMTGEERRELLEECWKSGVLVSTSVLQIVEDLKKDRQAYLKAIKMEIIYKDFDLVRITPHRRNTKEDHLNRLRFIDGRKHQETGKHFFELPSEEKPTARLTINVPEPDAAAPEPSVDLDRLKDAFASATSSPRLQAQLAHFAEAFMFWKKSEESEELEA